MELSNVDPPFYVVTLIHETMYPNFDHKLVKSLHSRGTRNLVKQWMMDNLQCDQSDSPQLWTNGV